MKRIISLLLFLCLAVLLAGCNKKSKETNEYHATVYSNRDNIMSEDFLFNNRIKKAYYYVYNEEGELVNTIIDDEAPEERTYIVKDNDTLSTMINKDSVTVDFDKQIVVVHLHFSYHSCRQLYLSSITYEEGTAQIKVYDKHKRGKVDNSGPDCAYTFIVLDKLDIETATFSYSTKEVK